MHQNRFKIEDKQKSCESNYKDPLMTYTLELAYTLKVSLSFLMDYHST